MRFNLFWLFDEKKSEETPMPKTDFKFRPGDKVYATFDREKIIGIVDTCAISLNPVPKYWVMFEVSRAFDIEGPSNDETMIEPHKGRVIRRKVQGWYPESFLEHAT